MADYVFLCYDRCTTCQKAEKWLKAKGVSYERRDIALDNPTAEELKAWQGAGGLPLKSFFNTSGMLYRQQGLKDKLPGLSEEEQVALLATEGMLVKRPLLIGHGVVLAGFRPEKWEAALQTP